MDNCSNNLTLFLIGGIGLSIVSLIGVIGNILCAIVLSRPSMRTSTNLILFGLSVGDFMYVSINLLTSGIPCSIQFFGVDSFESFYLTTFYPIKVTYITPVRSIALLGSTYFTLLVTVERFFVVHRPLMARPYCTNKNAIRASLVIVAFIILYTMPEWWDYKIESVYDENGSWAKYRILEGVTNNVVCDFYYNLQYMFVDVIIPLTLLTLLNISIYSKIRKANKMRESMTQVTSSEISLAKMLIWVVSIYLLCNLFALYMYMRYLVSSKDDTPEIIVVCRFLFSLNSAVNFIIYTFKAKKFRLMFLELFWRKKSSGPSSNNGPRSAEAGRGTTDRQRSATISTTNI